MADERINSCFVCMTRVAFRKRYLESKVHLSGTLHQLQGLKLTSEADCVPCLSGQMGVIWQEARLQI